MYDASNRKDIRRAEKAAKQAERTRIDYTRRIMSDTMGREWMYNLLLRCNIFHTPFVRGSVDGTAFNCGSQNIGLQVFVDVVTHCPNEYILMIQESQHKELTDDRYNRDDRSTWQQPGSTPADGRTSGPVTEWDPFTPDGADEGDPD